VGHLADFLRAISDFLTSRDTWIALLARLAITAIVLILTFFVSGFARLRFRSGLERSGLQLNVAVLLARLLWIGLWAFGVILVLYVFGVGLTPVAAFIGVVGLAASLALQQVLQNLVAGVYLLAERPFNIGDLIAVVGPAGANHEGTVEDIQMRTTHLRNRHGELILMPNSSVFSGVVTNRTAVGGYASHISITFPRTTQPDSVAPQLVSVLQDLPDVLTHPAPELRVDKVEKDDWAGSLMFWISRNGADGGAVWAIASAFPEATVDANVAAT
jgi:small-conductance mechanosensitive channel